MLQFPDRLRSNNLRLGFLLLRHGHICESQLLYALDQQQYSPQPLGALLQQLGWVSGATLHKALRQQQRLLLTATVVATLLPSRRPALPSNINRDLPAVRLPGADCRVTTSLNHHDRHSLLRVQELTLLRGAQRSSVFFCLYDEQRQPRVLRAGIERLAPRPHPSGHTDYWVEIVLSIELDGHDHGLNVLLKPERSYVADLATLTIATAALFDLAPTLAAERTSPCRSVRQAGTCH